MRYLVNKVKQEDVGRGVLNARGKTQSFGQGPEKREVTGTGDGTEPIGAELGTVRS